MGREWDKLVALVRRLRSPKGCPWDRAQTHESLIPYLREESKEVEEALLKGEWHEIEDELGDLLLQALLHAQIAAEKGLFDIEDVAKAQRLKLTRRHPHVFGDADYRTPEAVKLNWKEIKTAERTMREADLKARVKKKRRK
jgi:XTP/dITP diphosphohydrolase